MVSEVEIPASTVGFYSSCPKWGKCEKKRERPTARFTSESAIGKGWENQGNIPVEYS
jgi:hypothetical protein